MTHLVCLIDDEESSDFDSSDVDSDFSDLEEDDEAEDGCEGEADAALDDDAAALLNEFESAMLEADRDKCSANIYILLYHMYMHTGSGYVVYS